LGNCFHFDLKSRNLLHGPLKRLSPAFTASTDLRKHVRGTSTLFVIRFQQTHSSLDI